MNVSHPPRESEKTSRIMRSVRNTDTVAELALRRRLWRNGLRYRVRSNLIGKPDIVFPRDRLAVFVDGDFWHGNSWRVRGLASLEAQFPNNTEWWVKKITGNVARDQAVTEALEASGWCVLRLWESSVLDDPNRAAEMVFRILRPAEAFRPQQVSPIEKRRRGSVGRARP